MDTARFFPLRQRRSRKLMLRSELGSIELKVDYGQHSQTRSWMCPLRQQWGLKAHQKITPGFAEKLCFTVTATGSYEEAAQVASKWSGVIDDSVLHQLVQRIGSLAQQQAEQRFESAPQERQPQRVPK